eukprot:691613-Pelagomonas_calceolata.AAC.1
MARLVEASIQTSLLRPFSLVTLVSAHKGSWVETPRPVTRPGQKYAQHMIYDLKLGLERRASGHGISPAECHLLCHPQYRGYDHLHVSPASGKGGVTASRKADDSKSLHKTSHCLPTPLPQAWDHSKR